MGAVLDAVLGAVLGAVLEVSASSVMRHWQANGLKPHILRGFKVSRDPKFVENLEDIVGAHLGVVAEQGRALLPRHLREPLAPGVFKSLPELVTAIDDYVAHHNTDPKPLIWTKSARDILLKVIRADARFCSKQSGTLH